MGYCRWNSYWSSDGTLSATGVRPTRIAPRSRENAAAITRRLFGLSARLPASTYWGYVALTMSARKSARQKIEIARMGLFMTESFTTWVASESLSSGTERSGTGRRAWSEIRESSAMITQLATSEEPPYDRKGVVRPVSGMSSVTPPMTTKTCRAKTPPRPQATSLPKPSRQIRAVRSARSTMMP